MADDIDLMRSMRLEIDGQTLIAPCLEVTLYFAHAPLDHLREFAHSVLAALDDDLTRYVTGTMKRFARRGTKSDATLAAMFDRPRPSSLTWLCFRGSDVGSDDPGTSAACLQLPFRTRAPLPVAGPAHDRIVEGNRRAFEEEGAVLTPVLDCFRATFPLEHPLARPDALLGWLQGLQAVHGASFVSGHAGFAINAFMEVGSRSLRDAMSFAVVARLARHPGLGETIDNSPATRMRRHWPGHADFLPGIKRVQWLTLVPDLLLDAFCGGRAAAVAALEQEPGVVCHPLIGGGLVIQAGKAPSPGDVTTGDHLPAYRAVAQVLAPARMPYRGGLDLSLGQTYAAVCASWAAALETPVD